MDDADAAIRLFLDFLDRQEGGESLSIDDLCRARPEHADALRRHWHEWQEASRGLEALGHEAASRRVREPEEFVDLAGGPAHDPHWAAFLEQLRSRGPTWQRYVFRGEVARGGMGVIQKVYDQDARRHVALKVILGTGRDLPSGHTPEVDDRSLGRFLEEAQVTSQLDHPGIVPVHEIGVDQTGRVYFTMKLVKGEDLRAIYEMVKRSEGGWNVARALSVLLKVCEAMSYAHAKGVIHRDLKPANVMVGPFGEVFVMDWGLARLVGRADTKDVRPRIDAERSELRSARRDAAESPDTPIVTMDGDVVGTPAFMPPEQAKGLRDEIGPQSDVYAVGAMLYQLLAGHMPFVEDPSTVSPRTVLAMLLHGPPTPLPLCAPDAPAELVSITEKAMARDRRDRYPSMAALADDLRAYLEGRVVTAHEAGAWAELRKWLLRNKSLAGAAMTALLFLIIGLTASTKLYLEAREQSRVARARERDAERESAEVLRLADVKRLEQLTARQEELWPSVPENVPGLQAWLQEARALTARRLGHEMALQALLVHARPAPATLVRAPSFDDATIQWRHDVLAELVAGLAALDRNDPWGVTIPALERRLMDAQTIAAESIERHREEWDRVIGEIGTDARFAGLRLQPRVGFVPIGTDPVSGLHEFWHVPSGARPERDPSGRIRPRDDMGLVFVLLPAGRLLLGAQNHDPQGPNFDPDSDASESDARGLPVEVTLDPFYVSKYEMTQSQWETSFGSNPSYYHAGSSVPGPRITARNPVENVSWHDCERAARRLGFRLPTEAQWEYACRAGTDTPWHFGRDRTATAEYGNVADATALELAPSWNCDPDIRDGHLVHAPVGSFEPNAFGLHDVVGNVGEWCREGYSTYGRITPRPGDGERLEVGATERVLRGGSFRAKAVRSRSAIRVGDNPASLFIAFGLRPSAGIED